MKGKTKTQEEYIKQVASVNNDIEVVANYINSYTPITHRCKKCGHEWDAYPSNILSGRGCPQCNIFNMRSKIDVFKDKMKIVNSNIEIIGEYITNKTKILCKCKLDGHEWESTPNNLLRGHGCPMCTKCIKRTQAKYENDVNNINKNIIVLGEYKNIETPILHKCKKDGHEWMARPNDILRGKGCPVCKESVGEKTITNYLNTHNILFIPQYHIDECRDKRSLPFDFYLSEFNAMIEYDGIQHFKPIDHFGGESALKETVKHDKIKNNYCKNNNIPLLRIRYDEDAKTALDNFLNYLTTQNYYERAN